MKVDKKQRHVLSAILLTLLAITLLGGVGISDSQAANGNLTASPPVEYGLSRVWYNGFEATYYDFGPTSLKPADLYVFFYENGTQVLDQNPIIDVVKAGVYQNITTSDTDYSDFWRVKIAIVPNNYTANTITSLTQISAWRDAGNLTETSTDLVINAPVVSKDSTLKGDPEARSPIQGWYRGNEVYHFAFESNGRNVTFTGTNTTTTLTPEALFTSRGVVQNLANLTSATVKTSELWVFPNVEGQLPIAEASPSEGVYSPLRKVIEVSAPLSYVPNSVADAATLRDLVSHGNITLTTTTTLSNRPQVGGLKVVTGALMAEAARLEARLEALNASYNARLGALNSSLKGLERVLGQATGDLSLARAQLTSDQELIATLRSQVDTLKGQLVSNLGTTLGGVGVGVVGVLVAVLALFIALRRRGSGPESAGKS